MHTTSLAYEARRQLHSLGHSLLNNQQPVKQNYSKLVPPTTYHLIPIPSQPTTHHPASLTLPGSSSTETKKKKGSEPKRSPTFLPTHNTSGDRARIIYHVETTRSSGSSRKRTHVTDTRDRRNPMGSTWETAESRRREAQQARMGNSQCGMGREKARRVDFLLSDLRVTWG